MNTFFYRVDEVVKTFGHSESGEETFSHSLDFQFDTMRESRAQAYAYYTERLEVLSKEKEYFLPFAPTKDAAVGLIAIYALYLFFVECYNEEEYILHGLEGVEEEERNKTREIEQDVLTAFPEGNKK